MCMCACEKINMSLSTRQIDSCLGKCHKTRRWFLGVFPSDKLPRGRQQRPSSLVINLDPSGMPGSHWVAVFLPSDQPDIVEYYDSYGRPPQTPQILNWLLQQAGRHGRIVSNSRQVQSARTSTCGHHALYWIYCRSLGVPTAQIVRRQPTAQQFDKFVAKFTGRFCGIETHMYDKHFPGNQCCSKFSG